MRKSRGAVVLAAAALAGACSRACGGLGGLPPERPPLVRGPDGREYHLLDRGPYKAFYDRWGRLQRIEYDSNGDARPDQFAYHDGSKTPGRIEVDEDLDGRVDRWEYYDASGTLVKMGRSRTGGSPVLWSFPGPGGLPSRQEYDADGDGRVERVEILEGGRVVRVELDADRDGRFDRWQSWEAGRLAAEELDTDGEGQPDRRIRYGPQGNVLGMERLAR